MPKAYLYDASGHDREVAFAKLPARLARDTLLWVDVERGDADGIAAAAKRLKIDPAAVAALGDPSHSGELLRFTTHFQLGLCTPPSQGDSKAHRLDMLVAEQWLLTVRDGDVPFLAAFRDQDRAETMIGALTPATLTASLLDWHLETYFEAISEVEAAIDTLDEATLADRAAHPSLKRLATMRRRVSELRRRLAMQRSVFHGLLRPDFDPVAGTGAEAAYRMVDARFDRAVDALDRARDSVSGSFDLFATKTAQDTNELVKVLTFVTVVTGFTAAVAGVFGMNFETPFFKTGVHGFWTVVGSMIAIALGSALIARWRKWL